MAKKYLKPTANRLSAVGMLIKGGYIKTWAGLFDYLPPTVIAEKLGINNSRMKDLVADPSPLTQSQLAEIASLLGVELELITKLAQKAMPKKKK